MKSYSTFGESYHFSKSKIFRFLFNNFNYSLGAISILAMYSTDISDKIFIIVLIMHFKI